MSYDYFDWNYNIQSMVNFWSRNEEDFGKAHIYDGQVNNHKHIGRLKSTKQPLMTAEIRNAVCIAGFDWLSLQRVKQVIAGNLVNSNIALESFHIKHRGDLTDGELLVPKVLVVANHQVGRLLIDDNYDEGQLDYLYDELWDIGADMMLVYMGLPKAIYPPIKHMVYHPRLIDLVFPEQSKVRQLAEDNCLVTLVEGTDFNIIQKNVIKEWLQRPVDSLHRVYKYAQDFNEAMNTQLDQDVTFWSEAEVSHRNTALSPPSGYQTATEKHPLASLRRKKYSRFSRFKAKLAKVSQRDRRDYLQLPNDDAVEMSDIDSSYINASDYGSMLN